LKNPPKWVKVVGPELIEGLDRGFEGVVPGVSGIYMWKLAVRSRRPFDSKKQMVDHIDSRCSTPVGRTGGRLAHFVELQELTVAGKPLPEHKREFLLGRGNESRRKWMKAFLGSLEDFTPALYGGEAGRLDVRVTQHMNLETKFGRKVDADPVLSWSNLDFHYCDLDLFGGGDESTDMRQTLEWIAQMTSLSGYVERAG